MTDSSLAASETRPLEETGLDGIPEISLAAFARAPFSLVITNPNLPDNPIVFVNSAFEQVTGYKSDAAVGRNCRFLQGDATREESVDRLRQALIDGREVTVEITNYRADGEAFRNRLMISPMRSEDGEIAYFMAVQMRLDGDEAEVSEDVHHALQEIQHRVKNHLSMVVGMIRLQAKETTAAADFAVLSRRVQVLQLLYEQLSGAATRTGTNDDEVPLGAYLSRVANSIAYLDGRRGVRVTIDAEPIRVPFSTATHLGLILSELMTNAMQHAFEDRDEGVVKVSVASLSAGVVRISVIDDGVGIPDDVAWPSDKSLGGRIVGQLVESLDARLVIERGLVGTMAMIDVPARATVSG